MSQRRCETLNIYKKNIDCIYNVLITVNYSLFEQILCKELHCQGVSHHSECTLQSGLANLQRHAAEPQLIWPSLLSLF